MSPKVSVIIPCRNEAGNLPETLRSIHAEQNRCEIIVVTPDEADDSIPTALDHGARVAVAGRARRAFQMNHGAALAAADVLLFLHADTRLNPCSVAQAAQATARPGVVGGAFRRRFDTPSRFLRLTCLLAGWRGDLAGWHFGDQAIFARTEAHRSIGGFRDIDPFEDLDYCRRLKSIGKIETIRPAIISSARRFESEGPILRTWKDFWLTLHHLRCAQSEPTGLSNHFQPVRKAVERP